MEYNVNKTIVLVGLMGAGKSSIGWRLAKKLQIPFYDLDKVIEEREGKTISEIFAEYGEDYFRDLEEQIIREVLTRPPHVLATGGGAFIRKATREAISEHGISIWLRADLDTLVERVSRKNTRPLLEQGDKREIIEKLIKERYPLYEQADLTIDTEAGPHQKVVDKIINGLEKTLHQHKH